MRDTKKLKSLKIEKTKKKQRFLVQQLGEENMLLKRFGLSDKVQCESEPQRLKKNKPKRHVVILVKPSLLDNQVWKRLQINQGQDLQEALSPPQVHVNLVLVNTANQM